MATTASTDEHGVELSLRSWDSKRWPLQASDLNLDDGCPSFLEKCFDEGGHPIDAEIQAQINEWAASEDTQRELAIFGSESTQFEEPWRHDVHQMSRSVQSA